MDLTRARDTSTVGAAPKPPQKKTPPPPPAKPTGSSSQREREYKRDPKGSSTGGQFTKAPASTNGGRGKAGGAKNTDRGTRGPGTKTKGRTPPPLEFGARNDPDRVRFLQRLLKSLKIANLKVDGVYGESTERAVMALQRKLGMTESGKVSNGLLKRIRDAEILSPCAAGAKRSREMDEMDELIRAVATLEPDEDLDEALDEDYEPTTTRAYSSDPNEPYGDVDYADPGYQDDGKKRYPLDSEEHCRAAWSYINMGKNAAMYSPDELKRIKARIRSALDEYGVDTEDSGHSMMRCCAGDHTFAREWELDGIEILRGGDGRTVDAYAAPFDVPTEIHDQHGHYMETIHRSAFNEALAGGIGRVSVFYHHGMTLHGTPSDLGSVPIGSPLEIKADGRGLRTITRYNKSDLADAVLEAIRAGDLKGYSFRGPIRKSNPPRIARARAGAPLPQVVRMTLGLNEYGPTPSPYYADAKILAVRSAQAIAGNPAALAELLHTNRELARILSRSTPQDQERESATPTEGPGAEDQPHEALRSASMADIRRRIAVHKILGGRK